MQKLPKTMQYGLIKNSTDLRDLRFTGADDYISSWYKYLPTNEMQIGTYFDTSGCVTFAILNQIETKLNSLPHNQWLEENGYYDKNNKVNFSERFCLIQNGTTNRGNSGRKVYNSLRKTGLIPESRLPYPRLQREPVFDWDDFYDESVITDEMIALGKEFKERFDIKYYFVEQGQITEALKDSPLLCYVRTSCTEKIGCTGKPNHAVMYFTEDLLKGYMQVYDSYESSDKDYIRLMDKDYEFVYRLYSIKIKEKIMTNVKIIANKAKGSELGFYIPIKSEEAFESNCENYGLPVPKTGNGKIDWDNVKIDGETNIE